MADFCSIHRPFTTCSHEPLYRTLGPNPWPEPPWSDGPCCWFLCANVAGPVPTKPGTGLMLGILLSLCHSTNLHMISCVIYSCVSLAYIWTASL